MWRMSYLEPIGNIGGMSAPPAPPSPQAPVERGPAAPPSPSSQLQVSDVPISPGGYPGQPSFPSVNANLDGLNASPSPAPMRGLNAAPSSDGSGLPVPELSELDTSAVAPRPYGPWPTSTRPVMGADAAPGPYYMGGVGATPGLNRGPMDGVRPIAGLGAARAPMPLQVGRAEALERPIRPDPGVRVQIPVDSAGRFGPIAVPSIQNPMQSGWSDRGIPAFGNVAAVARTQPWRQ